jgi:hypothetical protein
VGVKRSGREADQSSPSTAEVNCVELYLHFNTPLRGGAQLKQRDNFTFMLHVHQAAVNLISISFHPVHHLRST